MIGPHSSKGIESLANNDFRSGDEVASEEISVSEFSGSV
jgi:hypothetical protein